MPLLMRPLTLGVDCSLSTLWLPDADYQMPVISGILFSTCIAFPLQLLELLQAMIAKEVLLLTHSHGHVGLCPKKHALNFCEIWLGFLAPLL